MTQNITEFDPQIYHFTKSEIALLHILPNLQLKLSPFLDSNDPKEYKTFGNWMIFEGCDDLSSIKIKASFKQFLTEHCKQLCFSDNYIARKNRTDWLICGAYNPIMWAHYGEKSKGICLGIDEKAFNSENQNLISKKVKYNRFLRYPKIEFRQWEKEKGDYFKFFLKRYSNQMFFQKYYEWKAEAEIKCIDLNDGDCCSIKNSLRRVYVGEQFDESLCRLLHTILPKDVLIERIQIFNGRILSLPHPH
jgi:hypothetical protein